MGIALESNMDIHWYVALNPKCQKSELQIEPYSVAEAWGHAVRP